MPNTSKKFDMSTYTRRRMKELRGERVYRDDPDQVRQAEEVALADLGETLHLHELHTLVGDVGGQASGGDQHRQRRRERERGDGEPELGLRERELGLDEPDDAGDHGGVESHQEATQRDDQRGSDDVETIRHGRMGGGGWPREEQASGRRPEGRQGSG